MHVLFRLCLSRLSHWLESLDPRVDSAGQVGPRLCDLADRALRTGQRGVAKGAYMLYLSFTTNLQRPVRRSTRTACAHFAKWAVSHSPSRRRNALVGRLQPSRTTAMLTCAYRPAAAMGRQHSQTRRAIPCAGYIVMPRYAGLPARLPAAAAACVHRLGRCS